MRVSTAQTYSRSMSLMSQLTAQADKAQTQISTGKRLVGASDDPGAYRQLAGLKVANADGSAYAANVATAQGIIEQSSDTLTDIETQLQRAQELFTSAGNGTLSDSDRDAIGKELDSIKDTLFALVNTKDSRGQPLFGGATGDMPYTKAADGTISYASSGEPSGIPIDDQTSMQVSVTGEQAFKSGSGDVFSVFAAFKTALAGGGDMQQASRDAIAANTDTLESVGLARTSVGARGTRLELAASSLESAALDRENTRSGIEDTDLASTITEFQKTLTVLQATQSSFTKLTSLSLFDYLR
jgi:flagellar hook-associated protein 3 FlgL